MRFFCERKKPVMELIKENIKVNDVVVNSTVQKTVDGDIIVPDSKPDILKILQVDAVSCITEKEINEGSISVKGRVDLKILYIPDSETECIKSILTSFDFEENISNKKIDSTDFAIVNSSVERAEFSLTNSRKLKIKSIVEIDYEIIRTIDIEPAVDCEEDMEIKRQSIVLRNSIGVDEFSFRVRDRIVVPSGQSSVGEVLKADYIMRDVDYTVINGRIMAKGSIGLCILYTGNDGKIEFFEGELPFAEVWDMEGLTEDTECEIEYSIEEGELLIEEDTDGDLREALASVIVTAQLKAAQSVEVDMIEDCYVPYKKTTASSEKISLEEVAARPSVQNTIREIVEISSSAPSVSNVYNVVTKPYITKVGFERNKLICEGKLEACILYVSDSNENPVYSIKKNIPFSYSMDCDAEGDGLVPKIKAEVKHTGYNLNAAGEVEIRCILAISANITRQIEFEMITNVECEESSVRNGSKIVIYFVQNGDSLWSVAKRYGVPCQTIREFNEMTDDNIKTGMRLLIPGR